MGDYYGPHWVNPGSKKISALSMSIQPKFVREMLLYLDAYKVLAPVIPKSSHCLQSLTRAIAGKTENRLKVDIHLQTGLISPTKQKGHPVVKGK